MDPLGSRFLNRMDKVKICQLRDPNVVAAWARYNLLNELGLLRYNVREEILRLEMNIDLMNSIMNEIVVYIWDHILTSDERERFTTSKNRVNDISRAQGDSLNRMNCIIDVDQITIESSSLEISLFSGTKKFYDKADIDFLIYTPGSTFA